MEENTNDKPWRRPVPEKQYRLIEGILFRYAELKEDVQFWRENIIEKGNKTLDGLPRATGVGDPTFKVAALLETPPYYIREKMQWIEVVNHFVKMLKAEDEKHDSHLYDIANEYYSLEKTAYTNRKNSVAIRKLAEKYYVSDSTMRRMKDYIVTVMWTVALWKGMITPEIQE